jgi:integrase
MARAIQRELGHENPQTTALYTRLTDPVQQDAARLINTLVDRLSVSLDGRVA